MKLDVTTLELFSTEQNKKQKVICATNQSKGYIIIGQRGLEKKNKRGA